MNIGGHAAGKRNETGIAEARDVVEIVNTSAPDAVSDAGLKLHAVPLGSPAHVNVTVPAEGATVRARLKLAAVPAGTVEVPGPVRPIVIAGEICAVNVEVLFAAFVSPPPDNVIVDTAVAGAFAATLKVTLMVGKLAAPANASARVQVKVASVQVQPVPLMAVALRPVASVLVTVTVPEDGAVPRFAMITE